jgi:preprotein translocase subunit Sec63
MVGQQPGFDPYQVLGLDKSASDEAIKKRYRELLQHLHPDTAGREGTSFLLQMVLAAYKLIEVQRGWQ